MLEKPDKTSSGSGMPAEPAAGRRTRRALPWALALLLAAAPATASDRMCLDAVPVCIESVERGPYLSFVVSNGTVAPYSVRVFPKDLENLKPLVPLPFRGVVGPGEEKVVGSLSPVDPDRPVRFGSEWNAAPGSLLARHDGAWHYRMPFSGTQHHVVSQGYGGRFSHQGTARYSVDFAMPWGTPVLAARAGRVIAVVDGNVASSLRKVYYDRANKVDVLHADGTVATYAHLRHGAVVEVGQEVATGDLIGLSGDTGFSGGPHLHFMVWKRLPDLSAVTLPVRFYDGTPEGVVPARGVAFAPACSTSGMGCAPGEGPPPSEAMPAAPTPGARRAVRDTDGACRCPNGSVLYVDLPCSLVCGR
jgi:murein DD-endopeptidase MepM/ murein hydrolase activator NlpD